MTIDNYKLINALKQRENMNIDRRERKDAPVFWITVVICVLALGYLTVIDERFDVPEKLILRR